MPNARLNHRPAEGGFVMIEVLVSALIILIVAGAVLALMTATTRSAADQRQKATAYSVAQEDQARMRAMRLTSLNRLAQERNVTLDGTKYTVLSTGRFVNNSTGGDSSCASGSSASDYVRIASKVTWENERRSVTLNSVVAPSNGSLNPNNGALLFTVENGQGQKVSGLGISGTGAGTFSGSTDANGCAAFFDLPVGNYSVKTEAAGFVDADGNPSPWTKTIGVQTATTSPVQLLYDQPGAIRAEFKYKEGAAFKTASSDSIVVYNSLMPSGADAFGTPGGTRFTALETPMTLFPFKEADTVYPGYCETNLPTEAAARATPIVARNTTVNTGQIQMPALFLTVKKSGSAVNGARVTLTDESCKSGSTNVKRVFTTDATGRMTEPGQPWGVYKVCVSSGSRWRAQSGVSVKNLSSGTSLTLEIPLSGSVSSGSETYGSGECP
ncbi:MAG: type II secretion system protein [Solirubrobacterales bacterium]